MPKIVQMLCDKIATPLQAMANPVLWGIGLIGGFLSYMLGGWDMALQGLVVFMVIDFITGVYAGTKTEGFDSRIGRSGIFGKVIIVTVVALAVQIDRTLSTTINRNVFIYFYLANELGSIIENLGKAGFPLPPMIKDLVKVLRKKQHYERRKEDNPCEILFPNKDREEDE